MAFYVTTLFDLLIGPMQVPRTVPLNSQQFVRRESAHGYVLVSTSSDRPVLGFFIIRTKAVYSGRGRCSCTTLGSRPAGILCPRSQASRTAQ